jgi:hypothetical protein
VIALELQGQGHTAMAEVVLSVVILRKFHGRGKMSVR